MEILVYVLTVCLAVFVTLYLSERKKHMAAVEKKPETTTDSEDEDNGEPAGVAEADMTRTRDFFIETLKKLGCQYDIDEESGGHIEFKWQGGFFVADAKNESPFVTVWYLQWDEHDIYDIDSLSRVKRVINDANINHNVVAFYSLNEAGNNFYVHSKCHFLMIKQIPDVESYLQAVLGNFFVARRYAEVELEKLANSET